MQEKEFKLLQNKKQMKIQMNEISALQTRLSLAQYEERLDRESYNSLMVSKEIRELEKELEITFSRVNCVERQLAEAHEKLALRETNQEELKDELQELQKALRHSRSQYFEKAAEQKMTELQLKSVQAENQILREQLRYSSANASSNSYSRKGQYTPVSDLHENLMFQTKERRYMPQTSPQHREPVSLSSEFIQRNKQTREHARKYNESTEEILEDTEMHHHETFSPKKEYTQMCTHKQTYPTEPEIHIDKVEQRRLENLLPEPPKYSAAENSVEIETFEKAFLMKYGSMIPAYQIMLLESKFLVGKALQVCKGLPENEKLSVQSILAAIRTRLRMSESDESRRAKSKWEGLSRNENQSVEDFCLVIDEIARKAFRGIPDFQLSSLKTAKLLDALRDETNLMCTLDVELMRTPEVKQYEICRILATRYELQVKERQMSQKHNRSMTNEKKVDRSTVSNNKNSSQQTQASVGNTPTQYRNANPKRNIFPVATSAIETPILKATGTSSAEHNGNTVTPPINNTAGTTGYSCSECNQTGCHAPNCSKAPGPTKPRASNTIVCFYCKEPGHFAHLCPKKSVNQSIGQQSAEQSTRVAQSISKVCLSVPSNENCNEGEKTPIKVLKGRIGNADVDIMLDSGACISLISEKTWKQIVSKNGSEFERNAIIPDPKPIEVFAANNQKIDLLFQVSVETSMHSRTSKVDFHIVNVERDTIILGIDQFAKLGVQVHVDEKPRDVKMAKQVTLYPGDTKFAEVRVEGIITNDKTQCFINPLVNQVSTSVCEVSSSGNAIIEVRNCSEHIIVLKKGDIVATGEFDGFDILDKEVDRHKLIDEHFPVKENDSEETVNVCAIGDGIESNERWNELCTHLKRDSNASDNEEKLWELIQKFQHIFALADNELGRTNVIECEIELVEGAQPVRQKPRPVPLAARPEIRKMIDKMLDQKVIRESKSSWASPVVLVKKKDNSIRMCIDYRKVNKVVKYNAHPLPNIEATLQSLAGKAVFSTLDLVSGYWQLPLKESSKEITAFVVGTEFYEWEVLPFGLVTSPALFQATMETVVGDLIGKCAFVYVDDLLVASENMEQHVLDLQRVLERVERSGLKFRASKCHLAKREVEYLGHKITPEGVKTEEKKVEKMRKFSRPTNLKELQSFLGLVGYYRKFIMTFSKIAAPLTPLTSKNSAWIWGVEQETAFQLLIEKVCSAPVLMQPNVEAAINGSRPFLIYTDASRQGIGAVLAQEADDGEQHPIAFSSRSLTSAETRYHVTDLEALAMMSALKRFKTIIYGTQVTVFTDHKPLVYLLKGSPLADRLLRWSIQIQEYNVRLVFVNGKANVVADALSRGGCPMIKAEDIETIELQNIIAEVKQSETVLQWNTNEWLSLLKKEDGWKDLIIRLENGEKTGTIHVPGHTKDISVENFMIIGNTLRYIDKEDSSKLVVPESEVSKIVAEAHAGALAGHFGTEKMFRQLSKRFFWLKMRATIEREVKSCQKCLCTNNHPKMIAPLKPYKTSRPLEIVACDLIDVGLSTNGNRYILSIIDLFTKFATAIPIPDKKAETVLQSFVDRWAVGEGRIPEVLLTDQGKEFLNENFKTFTKLMNIEHITTKGYNSRSNGAVERFNQTIMHIIKKKNNVPYEWDQQIAYAVFSYNSVAHKTTGESPYFLMNGRDARTGIEKTGDDTVGINYADMDEYKNVLVQEMNKAHEYVRQKAWEEQEEFKHLFDMRYKTDTKTYPKPGCRVLIEIPSEKLGARCPKLVNKWRGPYRVLSCSENSATVTPISGNGKEILQIPFDNMRILPSQMDDTPIVTKKNRNKITHTQANDSNCCSIVSEINPTKVICRNLYSCRCHTPCQFQYGKLSTPSPTEVNAWTQLRQRKPRLTDNELEILSQRPVPGLEHDPTEETLKIVAKCRTLHLWAKDVGWNRSLDIFHSNLVEEHFGKKALENAYKASVFALYGIKEEDTKLHGQSIVYLPKEGHLDKIMECLRRRTGVQIVVFILPFALPEEADEYWEECLKVIPEDIHVLLVPGYSRIPDYTETEAYSLLVRNLSRPKGVLMKISPTELVKTRQKRTVISLNGQDPTDYWKVIGEVIEEREDIIWPRFAVFDPSKVSKSKELESSSGPKTRENLDQGKTTPQKSWRDRRTDQTTGPIRRELPYAGRANVPYTRHPPFAAKSSQKQHFKKH
ncbi:hypothetical protein CAEBREN_28397 [Caenorhabditis brenneri]|uniref:RNA-directed DNA polymerase n=1 Tax=Caenorhabditis brenneri TaxID=135651 RepID=G0NV42_CAEBE|nr:hypothetical protein CAEBREN_28397 [Caenorhabditis brenneri]